MANDKESSYRSTALIALASLVNIFLSVVRNKVFSVFLGPVGIGQFGILNDFINSVFTLGSLGVSNGGVQAVSEAVSEGPSKVRQVYNGLNRIFLFLGVVIVVLIMVFAAPISRSLAGDNSFEWFIRIVAVSILIRFHAAIYTALVTGMQRMGVVAKTMIFQGIATTIATIIIVFVLRKNSIPFLVLTIWIASWFVSFLLSSKVLKELPDERNHASLKELWPFLVLGISTLWGAFLESVVAVANKSLISKGFGKEYLGYYQVSIGFTASYISFITTSIITQYYPKLVSKVGEGIQEVNEYVNQQLTISMTLIMPVLLVILTFSKLFIRIFFSDKFLVANQLVNYTVAGTLILVVAWPIAFVFLAYRRTGTYLLSESIGNGSMLALSFLAVESGSFNNLGLAYVLHYVIYIVLITYLYYSRFNGSISLDNYKLFFLNSLIILVIFGVKTLLNETSSYIVGSLLISYYMYRSRQEYIYIFKTVLKR